MTERMTEERLAELISAMPSTPYGFLDELVGNLKAEREHTQKLEQRIAELEAENAVLKESKTWWETTCVEWKKSCEKAWNNVDALRADNARLQKDISESCNDMRYETLHGCERAEKAEAALERVRKLPEKWRKDVVIIPSVNGFSFVQPRIKAKDCADELEAALKGEQK